MTVSNPITTELNEIQNCIFKPSGYVYRGLEMETESSEYSACTFRVNELVVNYRSAKITPKKTGQFVAIWKRNKFGITAPFEALDEFDLLMIYCKQGSNSGLFIFSKPVLLKMGIISDINKQGKRGMRVYPAWDKTENQQAKKTQAWQLNYFINITLPHNPDTNLVKKLMCTNP